MKIPATEWWLEDVALPDLHWARLRVFGNGTADVLDSDGRTHEFASAVDAANWLSEDEFVRSSTLDRDDLEIFGIAANEIPPPVAASDAELIPLMHQPCMGAEVLRDLAVVRWAEPWMRIEPPHRVPLERELERELGPSHALFGRSVRAVARRCDADDVLFVVEQPRELAVVHLTYTASPPEQAGWPSCTLYRDAREFIDAMLRDSAEYNNG